MCLSNVTPHRYSCRIMYPMLDLFDLLTLTDIYVNNKNTIWFDMSIWIYVHLYHLHHRNTQLSSTQLHSVSALNHQWWEINVIYFRKFWDIISVPPDNTVPAYTHRCAFALLCITFALLLIEKLLFAALTLFSCIARHHINISELCDGASLLKGL